HQQLFERQAILERNDDLAIQDEAGGTKLTKCGDDVGEIACEWLVGLRAQLDSVAIAERETAEPVPLGLVAPAVTDRYFLDRQGLHRSERQRQRQIGCGA